MAALHFARAATICPWDHENLLLWGRFVRLCYLCRWVRISDGQTPS